jgi:hypothetical protein
LEVLSPDSIESRKEKSREIPSLLRGELLQMEDESFEGAVQDPTLGDGKGELHQIGSEQGQFREGEFP